MNQEQTLTEIQNLVEGAELSLKEAKQLLVGLNGGSAASADHTSKAQARGGSRSEGSSQVIEGVFDGQHMVGPDGKQYSVPANYASKSKLVEGDLMKLTIDRFGNFLYKQIGPMERARVKGKLAKDESTSEWRAVADGKSYKILLASVTYFKGEEGDAVTVLVPKDKSSTWAAVENIIHGASAEEEAPTEAGDPTAAKLMSEPLPTTAPEKAAPRDDLSPLSASAPEPKSDPLSHAGSGFGSAPSTPSADTPASTPEPTPAPSTSGPMFGSSSGAPSAPAPSRDERSSDSSPMSDGPGFGGNVPEYSPEPAAGSPAPSTPEPEKQDAPTPPEGQGLGGGLGGNLSRFRSSGAPSSAPAPGSAPKAPGYQELNFDDDKDEFQEI